MIMKALGQLTKEMAGLMNQSLGGLFGTTQGPTTTTTNFYDRMVGSHQQVISQAIDTQAELDQQQDTNDTIREIFIAW